MGNEGLSEVDKIVSNAQKKAQIKSKTFYAVNIFKAKFVYTIVNFKIFYIT